MNYEQQCEHDARLAILAELARQTDATLNVLSLARIVDAMGIRRNREWIETQILWLASMRAVNTQTIDLPSIGNVVVATLTRTGRDHVDRRNRIVGVSAPADVE